MKNSYVFISTAKASIAEKAAGLFAGIFSCDEFPGAVSRTNMIYYAAKDKNIYCCSSINESISTGHGALADRMIKNGCAGSKTEHEIYSLAWLNGHHFYCNSDYMGIFTHYYYEDNNTFIASDNLLLIANLIDAQFSENGIFDAVLFKKPFGSNTWYQNIYCLTAGNILSFDMNSTKIDKIGSTDFNDLLDGSRSDYIDSFSEIFNKIKISENMSTCLSLSAGSDSRSVLAGLLNAKKKFKAYSWGGANYLETYKIRKIVQEFDLEWDLVDFAKLMNDYARYHYQSIYHSSGLSPAIHHFFYRANLPRNSYLFEGYGGSEFVKGEHSDGMYSDIFKAVIKENLSIKDSIARHFPGANASTLSNLTEYLSENYSQYFESINTDSGKKKFQLYLLNFLPAKIFSGIFKPSEIYGLNLIEPFFSPKILSSLFGNDLGIKENLSLRNDFAGVIKSIKPEALIIKKMNPVLYKSLLDRNVRYSEWNYPSLLIKTIRKVRQQFDKIILINHRIGSQVDYAGFEGHRKMISNRDPLSDLISTNSFPINNPYIMGVEVYLTALKHCASTEFIKNTLKGND